LKLTVLRESEFGGNRAKLDQRYLLAILLKELFSETRAVLAHLGDWASSH
jgi:hypothetical protein